MKKIYLSVCAMLFAAGSFAQSDVTFMVDMTPYITAGGTLAVNASNVKIAGNFTTNSAVVPDWDPTASPAFVNVSGNVYATTINFPAASAGLGLEFKFLLTTASWGNCNDITGANTQECLTIGDPCTNGSNDNRFYTIGTVNETICFEWNTCTVCSGVGVKESLTSLANLAVSPNPSVGNTVISYGLVSNENVQVRVYNTLGAEVAVLANEAQGVGTQIINWNTSSMDKGLYTVVVRTASGSKSMRVAVQ
jgi:hypothetical protein